MQRSFEQATRLKMRLAASGHVNYLAGARIARCRFGTRIFHLKNAESANFYTIALDETIAHRIKEAINHFRSHVFLALRTFANQERELFFCYCRQDISPA